MSGPVLEIQDLRVEFPGLGRTVQAVRGCDLEVRKGEVLGLVGESGCGKSVTAMACLGLVPTPGRVQGSIVVDGQQVVGAPEEQLANLRGGKAAMIFQNPGKALNPFFTVGRQITDPIRYHHQLGKAGARDVAVEALKAVRLPDPELALGKYPHQISGGQLQRVMIAMAIACEPILLMADEPTTALDVTIQGQVIVLIKELAMARGLTVLFITHDLGVVASLCDRVAVMYAGMVVETGKIDELFASPTHPYTRKLLSTVPRLGVGKTELSYIPGQVPDMAFPPQGCAFHPRCEFATEACRVRSPESRPMSDSHVVACHNTEAVTRLGGADAGRVA